MGTYRSVLRRITNVVLDKPHAQRVALRAASRRGRSIVTLWHRIAPTASAPHEIVPTVPLDRFEAHLDVIAELGHVVPLAALDGGPVPDADDHRPRFALTFDDDDWRHARHVLPVLMKRRLPATFFLSGRWLHGHGPYWWELLEQELNEQGPEPVARRYGLPAALDAPRVGRALAGTPAAFELAVRARTAGPSPMGQQDVEALVAGGMEIGFHTVEHDVLPTLGDEVLQQAVLVGRAELADAAGAPVTRFAYPHGLVNERVALSTGAAGYRSGWTTDKRVTRPGGAPMLRGRWDLARRPVDEFRAALLRGLARPGP